jgi:hypothetical protein
MMALSIRILVQMKFCGSLARQPTNSLENELACIVYIVMAYNFISAPGRRIPVKC